MVTLYQLISQHRRSRLTGKTFCNWYIVKWCSNAYTLVKTFLSSYCTILWKRQFFWNSWDIRFLQRIGRLDSPREWKRGASEFPYYSHTAGVLVGLVLSSPGQLPSWPPWSPPPSRHLEPWTGAQFLHKCFIAPCTGSLPPQSTFLVGPVQCLYHRVLHNCYIAPCTGFLLPWSWLLIQRTPFLQKKLWCWYFYSFLEEISAFKLGLVPFIRTKQGHPRWWRCLQIGWCFWSQWWWWWGDDVYDVRRRWWCRWWWWWWWRWGWGDDVDEVDDDDDDDGGGEAMMFMMCGAGGDNRRQWKAPQEASTRTWQSSAWAQFYCLPLIFFSVVLL